jgi:hypothetical protein
MKRDLTWGRLIFMFVLATLAASAAYALVRLLAAPAPAARSRYLLMLAQSLMGAAVMFLPSLVERRLHIVIPGRMFIFYVLFLYAAVFLGSVQRFYDRVPYWDRILHALSGLMLGALGFSVVSLLNDAERVRISLSPLFVSVFAFCFALALGAVWEIYEFVMDGLFGMDMQRFAAVGGPAYVGRDALLDTMSDLCLDGLGGLAISAAGYLSIRKGWGWMASLAMKRVEPPRRARRPPAHRASR